MLITSWLIEKLAFEYQVPEAQYIIRNAMIEDDLESPFLWLSREYRVESDHFRERYGEWYLDYVRWALEDSSRPLSPEIFLTEEDGASMGWTLGRIRRTSTFGVDAMVD